MPPSTQRPSRDQLRRYEETTRRATSFVRREYPNLVGIIVHGSVARRDAGPFSDIDLVRVTAGGRKQSEFSYFDGDIYVGVGILSIPQLEKEFTDPKQFFWARGSANTSTRILYDPKHTLRKIMKRWKHAEPSRRLLEEALWDEYHHLIEYSGKLRNGWFRNDAYLTRYAARIIAQHVENAVAALNDLSFISENYVWHQILNAKKKPKHLRTDYPLALGIEGTRNMKKVYRAALRLCGETLRLVRDQFGDRARNPLFRKLLAVSLEEHGL